MSTRTQIKFGSTLEGLVKDRLRQYEPAFLEVGNQYLFYGYRKPISSTYYAYMLFQASRTSGVLQAEVAVARDSRWPVTRLLDFPDIGIGGYRQNVHRLLKGFEHSDTYNSTESLCSLLLGLFRDMEQAVGKLAEKAIPRIRESFDVWEPLYQAWLKQDHDSTAPWGQRFPGVWCEGMAFEVLDSILRGRRYDRFMGPLKFRYRQPHVLSCHLFLLARAMEFLDPPDERSQPPQPPPVAESIVRRFPAALDDPSISLLGRLPQEGSVELSNEIKNRTNEYAFLKSLAAMECFFQVGEDGRPRGNELAVDPSLSTQSLIDSPIYDDPYQTAAATFSSPPPPPVAEYRPASPPPPVPSRPEPALRGDISQLMKRSPVVSDDDDDDPIAAMEARLGLR